MTEKCLKIKNKFHEKFGYYPEVPFDVIMEEPKASNEFYELLKTSIKNGVDETIRKYGTDPTYGTKQFKGIYVD